MDIVRTALHGERRQLRDLTLKSKAQWGYDEVTLDTWTLGYEEPSARAFREGYVQVLERENSIAGYYALSPYLPEVDLTHLFVKEGDWHRGIGSALLRAACVHAQELGGSSLLIVSDPKAADFYKAHGAQQHALVTYEDMPGYTSPVLRLPLDGVIDA